MLVYDNTEQRRQWLRDNTLYDEEDKKELLQLSDDEFDEWYFQVYEQYWEQIKCQKNL